LDRLHTVGDSSTYWSTIAQIVPVLAVAVVIEYREIGKRTLRPEAFVASRRVRVISGILLVLLTSGLLVSFGIAIEALQFGRPAGGMRGTVAAAGVYIAAATAIAGSASLLARALMGETLTQWARTVPWSRTQRRLRELVRGVEQREQDLRALRVRQVDLWSSHAGHVQSLVRMEAAVRASGRRTGTDLEGLRRDLEKHQRKLIETTQGRLDAEATVSDIRSKLALIPMMDDEDIERARKRLEQEATRAA
jgi:hypothetical protein